MASSSQIHALISNIAKDNNLNAEELITKYAPAPRRAPVARRPPPPVHTHELDDQVHDSCELCQSHGNTLAKPEGEEEYETVSSPVRTLRERLMMLATEDDFEDEEDEA